MTNEELQPLLTQADAEKQNGNYEEAERLANQVLTALSNSDTRAIGTADSLSLKVGATRMLGEISTGCRDYDKALEYLNEALQLCEESSDKSSLARTLGSIGNVHFSREDKQKALECYGRALAIDEELGNTSRVAVSIHNIGRIHQTQGDFIEALECFEKALSIHEESGNKQGIASSVGTIGGVYIDLVNYSKALEYCTKSLDIFNEVGDRKGVSRQLERIGSIYLDLSDYTKALEYFLRELEIIEELEDKEAFATCLCHIGIVYHSISDYTISLEYYKRAEIHAEEIGSASILESILCSIGNVYQSLEDYSTALTCYMKSLILNEKTGNKKGASIILGNIGNTHKKMRDFERAQECLLRALQIAEEIGASWPRLHWLLALGQLYSEQSQLSTDLTSAERFLKIAIADSTILGVKHITRDAAESCYRHFKDQERWQEALEMKELYDTIKDEINVEEVKKQESIRLQQKEIELARTAAAAELKATTGLLHRVLPEMIATRIISGEEEIADYFTSVSILFADIAGFTPISADMPAIVVVRFLNFVFAEFDRIMKKYGCEKIKTIGDGYMAVCGAPVECIDHAERLAAAALEMMETIVLPESIREHMPEGVELGIRIGLHTGPIVAGVIGEERFVYDIYSDAVNIAARMESHGVENKIHVSNDFYRHLQKRFAMTKNTTHGMSFVKRGEMEIKGKGMMRTYFLEKQQ